VLGPDGKREVSLAQEARPDFLVLRRPGFYEVRENRGLQLMAANPDPEEADLTRLSPDDRAVWMAGRTAEQQAAAVLPGTELEKRQTVWWNLLVVALLLALAEVYLANQYLGRRGSVVSLEAGGETVETAQEGSHVVE
jgi:hypothetical protein